MPTLRAILAALAATSLLTAQTASIGGRVSDESGAVVPAATVTLTRPGTPIRTTASGGDGKYLFRGLPAGDYAVSAAAPQLATPTPVNVALGAADRTVDLEMKVAATSAAVTVLANGGPAVSTEAASNANATALAGDDLKSLADDPDDLAADLAALAGPSAGPGGNEIFVDGFSGGQLPPKQSIREIRLNANPFSPEYDKIGLGRIEVFTKPGTDQFHGSATYNFGTDAWDARNPFAAAKAPLLNNEFDGSVSGPVAKHASFTLDAGRHAIDNGSVSNGETLDLASFTAVPFTSIQRTPQRENLLRPRFDYQLNENNYLSVRYQLAHSSIADDGIGAFDATSRGYSLRNDYDTAQITDTSIHGAVANETRFQFSRWAYTTAANTTGPAILVSGAFNGGAADNPHDHELNHAFELQNNTTIVRGAHVFRFGARPRYLTLASVSAQNFNGAFTFSGALAPELDAANQPIDGPNGQPLMEQISGIEQYRRTEYFMSLGYAPALIRALGGGASQFTIATGNPSTNVSRFDLGVFAGDEWRVRPGLTINAGLRIESENNIHDHFDPAPRLGLAWAPGARAGRTGRTVIRAGFGMFYDRFRLENSLAAARYNGLVQRQYVIADPDFFPAVPSPASLGESASQQSIRGIASNLQSPYIAQSAVTVERQLQANTTLAVTYTNAHSLHILRLEDINAPLGGVLPYPGLGPIFLTTSDGLFNQNQLSFNVNSKLNSGVSFYLTYVLAKAMSNSDGLTTPANPYNFSGEYGPAGTDVRHRVVFGGSIATRWGIRLSPLLTWQTGLPFNITTGNDPYGTTVFNARPGIGADPSKPGLIQTAYGLLDPNPSPGEQILGRNAGRGPFLIGANLRIAKTWSFGGERPAGRASHPPLFSSPASRRYNVTLSLAARNILNHVNPGPIVGSITSPLFGQANQVAGGPNADGFLENAANRRLEMQLNFAY